MTKNKVLHQLSEFVLLLLGFLCRDSSIAIRLTQDLVLLCFLISLSMFTCVEPTQLGQCIGEISERCICDGGSSGHRSCNASQWSQCLCSGERDVVSLDRAMGDLQFLDIGSSPEEQVDISSTFIDAGEYADMLSSIDQEGVNMDMSNVAPPDVDPPDVAPPDVAPPDVAPPDVAPPDVAPPDVAPPDVAPPDIAPPDMHSPDSELIEDAAVICVEGTQQDCFEGDPTQLNQGDCRAGIQSCREGLWGRCEGQTLPQQELCDNRDNDCNGEVDEGCPLCGDGVIDIGESCDHIRPQCLECQVQSVDVSAGGDYPSGFLASGFDDFIFTLDAPVQTALRTTGAACDCQNIPNCEAIDTEILLYQDQSLFLTNDDGGVELCSQLDQELPPGQYRAHVRGFASTAVPEYIFSVRFQENELNPNCNENGVREGEEECDEVTWDCLQCRVRPVFMPRSNDYDGGFQEDSFDRFLFELLTESYVIFETTGRDGESCPGDTLIAVHNVDDAGVRNPEPIAVDDDSGENLCSRLTYRLPTGIYEAIISGFNGASVPEYLLRADLDAPNPEEPPNPCRDELNSNICEWPNPQSRSISDRWIRDHHDNIEIMHPRFLVINFANGLGMNGNDELWPNSRFNLETLEDKVEGFFTLLREGSRYQALHRPESRPFLDPILERVVDLQDQNGHANSDAFPRGQLIPDSPAPGYRTVGYYELFSQGFAHHYNYLENGRFLTLSELVDRGHVHEVIIIANQVDGRTPNPPDQVTSNILEVAFVAQAYDEQLQPILGEYTKNGVPYERQKEDMARATAADHNSMPWIGRSLRIYFLNAARGPGCLLHSLGHEFEFRYNESQIWSPGTQWHTASLNPYMTPLFRRYAGFDLPSRFGAEFTSLYSGGNDYGYNDCEDGFCNTLTRYNPDEPENILEQIIDYRPACGNTHYTPVSRYGYEYDDSPVTVLSICETFMYPNEQAAPVSTQSWAPLRDNPAIDNDCGGAFLTYWLQNMPSRNSPSMLNGQPMKSWWPFMYY